MFRDELNSCVRILNQVIDDELKPELKSFVDNIPESLVKKVDDYIALVRVDYELASIMEYDGLNVLSEKVNLSDEYIIKYNICDNNISIFNIGRLDNYSLVIDHASSENDLKLSLFKNRIVADFTKKTGDTSDKSTIYYLDKKRNSFLVRRVLINYENGLLKPFPAKKITIKENEKHVIKTK